MPSVNIRVESVDSDKQQVGTPTQDTSKQQSQKLAVASVFAHQALNTAKTIANYGISNIGNFTGDYAKQDRVQEAVGWISDLATIGVGASQGWVGFAVAVIGVTTSRVLGVVNETQQAKHADRSAEYLRKRSGDSTTNGSRTGD